MTTKGAKEVLQHPLLDGLTKALIGVLVVMVSSGIGDLNVIKQQNAVQGEQISSLIRTAESRSGQDARIVAVELGKASKEQLQALRDTMSKMNVDLRALIDAKIHAATDRK